MLEGVKGILRGLVKELGTRTLSEKEIQRYVENFKLQLVANDVAVEVAEDLGERLAAKLKELRLKRFEDSSAEIRKMMTEL